MLIRTVRNTCVACFSEGGTGRYGSGQLKDNLSFAAAVGDQGMLRGGAPRFDGGAYRGGGEFRGGAFFTK